VETIYQSVLDWIFSEDRSSFLDPFKGTEKEASEITKESRIKDKNIKTENYMRNNKRTIRLTESELHMVIAESVRRCLTELDARTYASYAQKRAQQGNYEKAVQGQRAAVDAWNQQYGRSRRTPNGFVQKADDGGQWNGYDQDTYRMSLKAKDPNKPIQWNSPDYWKDEYDNHGYGTERWQSQNYPGPNNMDDQETHTTYDPYADKTNSTTYGRMKYNTVGSTGKWGYNNPNLGDYSGKPVRDRHNWASGEEGDRVAKQMAQGTGKYIKGKGWQ